MLRLLLCSIIGLCLGVGAPPSPREAPPPKELPAPKELPPPKELPAPGELALPKEVAPPLMDSWREDEEGNMWLYLVPNAISDEDTAETIIEKSAAVRWLPDGTMEIVLWGAAMRADMSCHPNGCGGQCCTVMTTSDQEVSGGTVTVCQYCNCCTPTGCTKAIPTCWEQPQPAPPSD